MPQYCQHHLLESLPFGPPLLSSWNLLVSLLPAIVLGQSLPLLKVWRKMSKVQDHLRAGVTLHRNCSVTLSAHQALKEKKPLIFIITCAWNALLSAFTCRILLVLQRAAKNYLLQEAPLLSAFHDYSCRFSEHHLKASPFSKGFFFNILPYLMLHLWGQGNALWCGNW